MNTDTGSFPLSAIAKEFEDLEKKFPKTRGIGMAIGPALILWGYNMRIPGYTEILERFKASGMGRGGIIVSCKPGKIKSGFAFITEEKKVHCKVIDGTFMYDVLEGLKEVMLAARIKDELNEKGTDSN